MTKRVRKTAAASTSITVAPLSTTIRTWLGVSFTLILGTVLVLAAVKQPLGQGYFTYRYSPVRAARTIRAAPCVLIATVAAASVWLLVARRKWSIPLLIAT